MRYRFQFRRYRLPFRAAVRTAHGVWAEREGVIVRLDGETGSAGFGEAAPLPGFSRETVDEIAAVCSDLGAIVDDARLDAVPLALASLRGALTTARTRNAPELSRKHLGIAALLPAGRAAFAQI